jgi:hypothetical protein
VKTTIVTTAVIVLAVACGLAATAWSQTTRPQEPRRALARPAASAPARPADALEADESAPPRRPAPAAPGEAAPVRAAVQDAGAPGESDQPATTQAAPIYPRHRLPPATAPDIALPEIPPSRLGWLESLHAPQLNIPPLTWFAIVVILLLTLTSAPLLSGRSLDGCLLAFSAFLLALRQNEWPAFGDWTWRGIAYLGLTIIAGYWVIRGFQLVQRMTAPRGEVNVSEAGQLVLGLAALALAFHTIATAPISPSSRDGVIGGMHLATTGMLPYGETVGHDQHSPLLYALHAGACRIPGMQPRVDVNGELVPITWDQRPKWADVNWWERDTLGAARIVNGALYLVTLLTLMGVGRRLHSPGMGLTMGVLFTVFPGTLECLTRPEIMLPTMLMSLSICCALLRGLGGFLAALLMVLAGLAWPWALLGLPVLIAWCLLRGWQGTGCILGLCTAVAAGVVGLVFHVEPALPRGDVQLAAGLPTTHVATLSEEGVVVIEPRSAAAEPSTDLKSWMWKFLLERDEAALDVSKFAHGAGREATASGPGSVPFRALAASAAARERLRIDYRAAVATKAPSNAFWPKLRTLLEATWLPAATVSPPARGAWHVAAGDNPDLIGRWTNVRRVVKVGVGVLALALAILIFARGFDQTHQLIGAVVVVIAAAQLVSVAGAAANLAWLAAGVVLLLPAHGGTTPRPAAAGAALAGGGAPGAPPRPGAAPRISVER